MTPINKKVFIWSVLLCVAVFALSVGAFNVAHATFIPSDDEIRNTYGNDIHHDAWSSYCNVLRQSPVFSHICRVLPWYPCCQTQQPPQNITCSSSSQCGTDAYTGSPYCSGNNVYQTYTTYTCSNAGTCNSTCTSATSPKLKTTCGTNQACNNGSCVTQNITCSSNSTCGTDSYIGSPFCQGNGVYQNYITYTCSNAGTANSYCSNSTSAKPKTTCGTNQTCANGSCANQNITCSSSSDCGTSGYTGSPYCNNSNVYQNYLTYTCNNAGTANSYCSNSTSQQLKTTCGTNQTCNNGSCAAQNIACSSNSACGTDSYIGSPFCQGNGVYQNYLTYTCNNAGSANSYCSNSTTQQLKTTCGTNQTCNNGSCSNQNITCSSSSDCGTSGYTGSAFCNGNSVYQNYTTYTCNNAGSANSYCSNSTNQQLKTTCYGNQTCNNGSCSGNNCTQNSYRQCSGSYLYWYDSCGNQQSVAEYCSNGCSGSSCYNNNNYCTQNSYQRCSGNTLYWYDSCGNQGSVAQYCSGGCANNSCQYYTGLCTQNSYQRCSGNYLYWYDSCGNQSGSSQYCSGGCYNNVCNNNYNYNNYYNYNNNYNSGCTYHAYKLCVGNNVYWYDSCGTQQDLVQSCSGSNMVCQYGQCAYQQTTPINNTYVSHYRIGCYSSNLYWYDNLGAKTGLYKSCDDANTCTADLCSASKCVNTIRCDGSTCASGTADYVKYCGGNNNNNNNNNQNNNQNVSVVSISFFAKENSASTQWQKTAQIGSNGQVYFMISIVNNGATQADNVTVSANIPTEITSLGNLQINGVPVTGDIVAGVNVGSLAAGNSKTLTFEGKAQTILLQAGKQATATVNVSGLPQSDVVSINLIPGQVAGASVSDSETATGFMAFLKRWYLWIFVGLVLLFLFVIIFRRLSNNA